jgi:hypothetical protein
MNQSELNILEHIVDRLFADRSVDAPADVVHNAKDLYRNRQVDRRETGILRRLIATLAIDLRPDTPAFGERSVAGVDARQLLFEAGENAVDLRVISNVNRFAIRGQILGNGFANGRAKLSGAVTSAFTNLNKTSSFRLLSIPPGEYSLSIRGEDLDILIESLDLT